MVRYDANIIQNHAEALYRWASRIQVTRTIAWALLGVVVTYLAIVALEDVLLGSLSPAMGAGAAAVLLGLAGYRSSEALAARLRLEAQTALCQVEIEKNTSGET